MNKREVIEYCLSHPNTYVDYPFGSKYTAIRYISNKYIFALVYERDNKLCVELICDYPDVLRRAFDDITPGYRMRNWYWNTVVVGGDVGDLELFFMIHQSYKHVRPRLRAHDKTLVTWSKPWPVNFYCNIFGLSGETYPEMPSDPFQVIEYVLSMYTPREKEIILARYKEYMVYDEIGAIHHISGSRVAQIHDRVMRQIRRSSIISDLIKNKQPIWFTFTPVAFTSLDSL